MKADILSFTSPVSGFVTGVWANTVNTFAMPPLLILEEGERGGGGGGGGEGGGGGGGGGGGEGGGEGGERGVTVIRV